MSLGYAGFTIMESNGTDYLAAGPAGLIFNRSGGYIQLEPENFIMSGGYLRIPSLDYGAGSEVIATREWVAANYSGGGGGGSVGTLDQVLAAGYSATDKQIHVADTYGQQWVNIQSNIVQVRDPGGDVTVNPNSIAMNTGMGASGSIALDPMMMMTGSLLIPETPGAEVIATREWVSANYSGGGGGAGDLQGVLSAGNSSVGQSIMLQDAMFDFSLSLNPNFLSVSNMMGAAGQLTPMNLTLNDAGGGGQIQLMADSMMGAIGISLTDSNGMSQIIRDSTSGNGTLVVPDTSYSPQIIATREYVQQQGDTMSRPVAPVVAEQYFDTTLGKPIWYNGSGWVDATGTVV